MKVRVALGVRSLARVRRLVEASGAVVVREAGGPDAWEALRHALAQGDADLVVVDRATLSAQARERVREARTLAGAPEVVVLSEEEDAADRASLLAAGALGVLNQGLPDGTLGDSLAALLGRRHGDLLRRHRASLPARERGLADLSTGNPAMRRLLETARRVVPSDSSILILGETGVGKEWLARAIHHDGPRRTGPFVAVNCGALPEHLLESELFGHERGAFTGAIRAHRGHFEVAHQGTLFLDEVAELPPHLQVKLLRVLQERKVQRVGGERATDVDIRVIAATNRDVGTELRHGRLREDLYYRLAVVTLTVPPLRERPEDVPVLANAYLERFRSTLRPDVRAFSDAALAALVRYRWPGNVRELINVIERAVLLSAGEEIAAADLPEEIGRGAAPAAAAAPPRRDGTDLVPYETARQEVLATFERGYLEDVLRRAGGRVGEAALRAGLNPRTLYALMRRHGLKKEDYRWAQPVGEGSSHAAP